MKSVSGKWERVRYGGGRPYMLILISVCGS